MKIASTSPAAARICPCGIPFPPDRARQARYHSDACANAFQQRAHRRREGLTPPSPRPPLFTAAELETRASLAAQAHALAIEEAGGFHVSSPLGRIAASPTLRQLFDSGYLEFVPADSPEDQMRARIGMPLRFPKGEWEWLRKRCGRAAA